MGSLCIANVKGQVSWHLVVYRYKSFILGNIQRCQGRVNLGDSESELEGGIYQGPIRKFTSHRTKRVGCEDIAKICDIMNPCPNHISRTSQITRGYEHITSQAICTNRSKPYKYSLYAPLSKKIWKRIYRFFFQAS